MPLIPQSGRRASSSRVKRVAILRRRRAVVPVTPSTAPGRFIWLRADEGVNAQGAALFDEAQSHHLSIPDNASLSLSGQTEFWVACWVKLDELLSTTMSIAGQFDAASSDGQSWRLRLLPGTAEVSASVNANGDKLLNTGFNLTVGQWYFLLFWRDINNSSLNVSINAANSFDRFLVNECG